MQLHGHSLIAGRQTTAHSNFFHAESPLDCSKLPCQFFDATDADIDEAMKQSAAAFTAFSRTSGPMRAGLLEAIAAEILALGDDLLKQAHLESGLPMDRLTMERGRTVGQLKMFADVAREGSWVDARIDTAIPDRPVIPKPDLRRMLLPIGPVVVFGASNFPLAFSVPGGDTASALAAGCTVVVKAHPKHPGTSELVAEAINRAVAKCNLPAGTFSMLHGNAAAVGIAMVKHPAACAVAFTGSHSAGRALFDAASARPQPIPVFAEMSSLNPVFLLPGALKARGEKIAGALATSFTMGVGQFCTKPGLIFAQAGRELQDFMVALRQIVEKLPPATMLHKGIQNSFRAGSQKVKSSPGMAVLAQAATPADDAKTQAQPTLLATNAAVFKSHPELSEEVFGPLTIVVSCESAHTLEEIASSLQGQLTATIHCADEDAATASSLLEILKTKAGRVIFNGIPSGVEVSPAMHHGGPYPATTDTRFTSVGTAAILRFARPVCFQNTPAAMLPPELQDTNPAKIWRMVDGKMTR